MSTEDNKTLARWFEVEHQTEQYSTVADELLALTVAVHFSFPGTPDSLDRAGWKHLVATFRASFTDMQHTSEAY